MPTTLIATLEPTAERDSILSAIGLLRGVVSVAEAPPPPPARPPSNILFAHSFDPFGPEAQPGAGLSVVKGGQAITDEVAPLSGQSCVKFSISSDDPDYERRRRSMLMHYPHPDNAGTELGKWGTFDMIKGEIFWYGFAIYIPADWAGSALVWQQKAGLQYAFYDGDAGVRTGMNPPIALYADYRQNQLRWRLLVKAGEDMIAGPSDKAKASAVFLGPVMLGAWNRFAIQVQYTHLDHGFVRLWVNGSKFEYKGRTVSAPPGFREAERKAAGIPYRYGAPHNFSFGLYRPEWGDNPPKGQTATLYFDSLRVAGAGAVLADVLPG